MKRRTVLKLGLVIVGSGFVGCGDTTCRINDDSSTPKAIALYSDPMKERTLVIDIENMELIDEIYSNGENTYNVDILDSNNSTSRYNKVFVMTRDSDSVDVINTDTFKNEATIELEHHPRSGVFNPCLQLMLISGKDKVMSSLIDIETNEVVLTVGENREANPKDYGGSNATGHPYWVSEGQFLMLDRENREIQLFALSYKDGVWSAILQDRMKTSTSVHHVIKEGFYDSNTISAGCFCIDIFDEKKIFYAVTEGSFDDKIAPSVIKFRVSDDKLIFNGEIDIGFDEDEEKGIHHILFHPTQKLIYIPSKEGNLYIVDYEKMEIISTLKTGKGSGHISFAPKRGLAVITNHNDKFVTIVDIKRNKKIKDVIVSGEQINNEMLQSHTQYIDEKEKCFYAFATDNGKFYKLSLDTFKVIKTLYTGGTPKQGGVIFKIEDSN